MSYTNLLLHLGTFAQVSGGIALTTYANSGDKIFSGAMGIVGVGYFYLYTAEMNKFKRFGLAGLTFITLANLSR